MKKIIRKMTALSLSVVLALGMLASSASAASVSVSKTSTVYMTSKKGTGSASIYVDGANKFSSLTSSKTSVAAISSVSGTSNSYSSYDASLNQTYSGSSKWSYIYLTTKKAGSTTIKFKSGGKTYSTTLKVKSYTNPASSVKISGVSSGKNVASKLKSSASYSGLKLSKTTSGASIKVKAKSGWRISYIGLSNTKNGAYYSYSKYTNPTQSATLRVGTLKKGTPYSLNITFVNKSNKASINAYYSFK